MKKYILIFFAGCLSSLAFPSLFLIPFFVIGFIIFFQRLWYDLEDQNYFLTGLAFGLGHFFVGLHWIYFPITFDPAYAQWALLMTFIFTVAMGLFFAIPSVIIGHIFKKIKRFNLFFSFKVFLFSLIFFLSELTRSYIFGGFPWNLFSHIWAVDYRLISITSILGIHGLSFVTIYWVAFISIFLKKNKLYALFCFAVLPITLFFVGNNYKTNENGKKIIIRVVQPNIPQKDKWSKNKIYGNLDRLINLSNKNSDLQKPDLLIWPESALTFVVNENRYLLDYLRDNLDKEILLVTGGLRRESLKKENKIYNSLFLIKNGNILNFYDKKKLVPFGEYMPFRKYIKFKKLTRGNQDFSAGNQSNIIEVLINENSIKIMTNICYEGIFPHIHSPVDLVINITNDAWFGSTTGPSQHLMANRSRIVEIGSPGVRVANSGISAFFDANGKISQKIDLNVRDYIQQEINLVNNKSIFIKFGNKLIISLIFIIAIASIIIDRFVKKSRKKDFLV